MLSEILSIVQIVLQLVAAVLAFRIGKVLDVKLWWAVIVAFLLMAFRRVTALLIVWGLVPELSGVIGGIDRIYLPLFISVFLTIGIYVMYIKLNRMVAVRK